MASGDGFGPALRELRNRASPVGLGLPSGGFRRVPGLRREELAAAAHLSVDYIVRLEQGRADNPSPQVVAALARGLQLSSHELDRLFRLAGHLPPSERTLPSHISAGVQRIVNRLHEAPLAIYDAAWTLLSHNELWQMLLGDAAARVGENLIRATFGGEPNRVLADVEHHERFRRALVADLRMTSDRYPHDLPTRQLIAELLRSSSDFATLWNEGAVQPFTVEQKTIEHPEVGVLTLDCDVLTSPDNDLRIVVYTAAESSDSTRKLRMLSAGEGGTGRTTDIVPTARSLGA